MYFYKTSPQPYGGKAFVTGLAMSTGLGASPTHSITPVMIFLWQTQLTNQTCAHAQGPCLPDIIQVGNYSLPGKCLQTPVASSQPRTEVYPKLSIKSNLLPWPEMPTMIQPLPLPPAHLQPHSLSLHQTRRDLYSAPRTGHQAAVSSALCLLVSQTLIFSPKES